MLCHRNVWFQICAALLNTAASLASFDDSMMVSSDCVSYFVPLIAAFSLST